MSQPTNISISILFVTLTFSDLNVFEGHLRSRVTDEHLSIQSKHDVLLWQVDHAAHNITRQPLPAKWFIPYVPTLRLWVKIRKLDYKSTVLILKNNAFLKREILLIKMINIKKTIYNVTKDFK